MQFWELMLIAVSLSMDAFAVSMCRGLEMKRFRWGHAAVIALFFGGFQAFGGKALQGGGRGDFGADAPQNRGKAETALTWVRTRFFCRTSARG